MNKQLKSKHLIKRPSLRRSAKKNVDQFRLNSLINSMSDGVIAVDSSLIIRVYNGAVLNILDSNQTLDGLALASVLKLSDRDNQPLDLEALFSSLTTGVSYRQYGINYGDGSRVSLQISISPVRSTYGKASQEGFVILLRDITREKSLEDERDEFISVVSHELRTPIAITEGNIGNAMFVAEKSGDIGQIKESLKAAHEQALFLADLINDLSTLSRAERGKLVYEPETIKIDQLLKELKQSYQAQAKEKDLKLIVKPIKGQPTLLTSSLYLKEILQNFITNAIKYTPSGQISVAAAPTKRGISFRVSDTGIGISKLDQEKIFDRFYRSEDYKTRQTSGTGLGLYVTLKLADIIHAKIDVSSQLGKGSTFVIDVPNLPKG